MSARDLEHREAARRQRAHEFCDVAALQSRRHVLQHDDRIDQIDAGIGQKAQIAMHVLDEAQIGALGVEFARALDHARRDVDSDHLSVT